VINELGEHFRTNDAFATVPIELPREQIECIGRELELHNLTRWLLIERRCRVAIWGPKGIGKTTLVRRFEETYRLATRGVALTLAQSPDPIDQVERMNPGTRDLLIVDDLIHDTEGVLDGLASRYPHQRVLFVSRTKPSSPAADAVLQLGGLPVHAIARLLRRAGLAEPTADQAAEKLKTELYGHPMIVSTVAQLLSHRIPIDQIIGDLQPFEQLGIRPDPGSDMAQVVNTIIDQSESLFDLVRRRPSLVHNLTPRKFEELVAEMLTRDGFDVTLTPIARDGGKDMYAAKKSNLGTFLYIVECKKYAPEHPVGVSLVRHLHGVVQAESATAGILVTTSRFTKPAQDFQEKIRYQLSLRDYHDLARWLRTSAVV
jgi:restriction system protein